MVIDESFEKKEFTAVSIETLSFFNGISTDLFIKLNTGRYVKLFKEGDIIDDSDITKGSFGRRGALDLIGDRYYRNDFYNKIQKDIYRQVLRIMADDLDGWVTRQKISERFKGSGAILNNAIKALRDRHIILSKEGERGVCRLQHKGFAVWIKLYTKPTLENGSITLTTGTSSPLTES